jgi:hypothetical protein
MARTQRPFQVRLSLRRAPSPSLGHWHCAGPSLSYIRAEHASSATPPLPAGTDPRRLAKMTLCRICTCVAESGGLLIGHTRPKNRGLGEKRNILWIQHSIKVDQTVALRSNVPSDPDHFVSTAGMTTSGACLQCKKRSWCGHKRTDCKMLLEIVTSEFL